jgi:hypothetical protein
MEVEGMVGVRFDPGALANGNRQGKIKLQKRRNG